MSTTRVIRIMPRWWWWHRRRWRRWVNAPACGWPFSLHLLGRPISARATHSYQSDPATRRRLKFELPINITHAKYIFVRVYILSPNLEYYLQELVLQIQCESGDQWICKWVNLMHTTNRQCSGASGPFCSGDAHICVCMCLLCVNEQSRLNAETCVAFSDSRPFRAL